MADFTLYSHTGGPNGQRPSSGKARSHRSAMTPCPGHGRTPPELTLTQTLALRTLLHAHLQAGRLPSFSMSSTYRTRPSSQSCP